MVGIDVIIDNIILAAVRTLSRFGTVRAAYLFGSQADGTADEWSDIDIAAFMDEIENWDVEKRAGIAARVMLEAGDDVEVHLFPSSSLEKPERGSFAEYILKHGVRLPEP